MLDRGRPQGLRLGIDLEAKTLMSNSGVDAFSIASRRAQEASSEQMERDWSRVAATIARRTKKRTLTSISRWPFALIWLYGKTILLTSERPVRFFTFSLAGAYKQGSNTKRSRLSFRFAPRANSVSG
jgi:hypothetical protein